MIAYSEQSLDNLVITEEAGIARSRRLINEAEYAAITRAHNPELYSPNIFIRIGLFILTVVIVSMGHGLLLMMTGIFSNETAMFVLTAVFGCFIYIALEWIVQVKRHYRSGVDDALLWLCLTVIVADVSIYFNLSALNISVLVFVVSLAATIRFANSVMSAVTFCSFISVIFLSISPFGTMAKVILPFLVMFIAISIYFIVRKVRLLPALRHYHFCFMMLEVLSLITAYVSVNYLIVRQLSIEMFNLPQNTVIAGGWFFWTCTFALPVIYIVRGLQRKDHLIMRVGLLLVAATVFTYRYYYNIAPVEYVMTVGGMLMIVLAYAAIRYLQTPRNGITDRSPDEIHNDDGVQVESLVVAESFKEMPAPDQGFQFGGGSTGGGGATGQF